MTPILVKEDAVKYITWDSNQWVSYDDEETFRMKREYANSLCLGGISVWALDLDKPIEQTSVNNLLGSEMSLNSKWNTLASRRAIIRSNVLTLGLFWTACQPPFGGADGKMCPEGYRPIALAHGKVFDADLNHLTGEGCHGTPSPQKLVRLPLTLDRWWESVGINGRSALQPMCNTIVCYGALGAVQRRVIASVRAVGSH